jgi:adenylyltransferase/sulfurtransferase
MQATEIIKYITKTGELLAGKVLIMDTLTLQSRIIKIGKVTKTKITHIVETVDTPVMSVNDVKAGLADDTIELVDVRTDQERDVVDIGGVHIEADELEENLEYLNNGKIKVLYCSSGKRSGEAVKVIKQKIPAAQLFSLQGGLKAWFEDEV